MSVAKIRVAILVIVSILATISILVYLYSLSLQALEKYFWVSVIVLLILYWALFINWCRKAMKVKRVSVSVMKPIAKPAAKRAVRKSKLRTKKRTRRKR